MFLSAPLVSVVTLLLCWSPKFSQEKFSKCPILEFFYLLNDLTKKKVNSLFDLVPCCGAVPRCSLTDPGLGAYV